MVQDGGRAVDANGLALLALLRIGERGLVGRFADGDARKLLNLLEQLGTAARTAKVDPVTAAFVAVHRVDAGDDALRPKAWLHLSIGYGVDDLTAADAAARELDPTVAAPWEIALWQRHRDGHWSRPSRRRLPRPAP